MRCGHGKNAFIGGLIGAAAGSFLGWAFGIPGVTRSDANMWQGAALGGALGAGVGAIPTPKCGR